MEKWDQRLNETQICRDCIGTGCVNLKTCIYCEGTGQVLTYRARVARQEAAAPKYTQAEYDTLLNVINVLRRGNKCWCQTWVGGEHEPECAAARDALTAIALTPQSHQAGN
jgi:hypothetical protein